MRNRTPRPPEPPMIRALRGCAATALFGFAVLLVLVSFGATTEMETFPGLRENRSWMVVLLLVLALAATALGLLLSGWRSFGGRAAVACLVVVMALRMWTLAPVLHCWSYDSVGRGDDGTYTCANRNGTAQ
ncbi:hypothetical protein [Nocardiopsis aegyptia]|uniref:Uncharacterized protein n=1 Tax=Nocardiopsis aegyptia TaxID=220378 RepID=A0A7Z0ERP7_9ACTN|nr:hypothetical protein [Nocardiopsis aegyptia]NYJ37087.1 hypothetical protein [Nocardiopsis aegyptia]